MVIGQLSIYQDDDEKSQAKIWLLSKFQSFKTKK